MSIRGSKIHARLLCSAAGAALLLYAGAAQAQAEPQDIRRIDIAPQSLASALHEFGVQSGHQVLFKSSTTLSKTSPGATADGDMDAALAQLLAGTGMSFRRAGDVFLIEPEGGSDPQSGSAAGDGADGTVDALIVTAQKREEDIQDVPIAISAFTQETLERSQVAGGPDLMTQVPNMTFTKTNFSSYSVQLRGIGTQAISATTDPAVAIAFNNTPFIRNRFFEQEFYDLQRVEVLRGPQGTLYGRNATAGVVNIISQKPKFAYEAKLSADVANYNSTRIEGMINIPLAQDIAAIRLAGAWTKRDGFVTNEITGNPIDGRDLWSTRVSLRAAPTDGIEANLIWEHFEEDDDRLRSGKQLCKKDIVTEIGGIEIDYNAPLQGFGSPQANFSQGCARASLYSPDSFETPNGWALPYYHPLGAIFLPTIDGLDPYTSGFQSRDLRVIESTVDPTYRAKTDIAELQLSFDVTDSLTLTSESAWMSDFIYSSQDFNRFNTAPNAFRLEPDLIDRGILDEDGNFCDPQIGCANRLVAVDLSTARSRQFSQEFRLGSSFEGPFNFSLGANYLRYDTAEKYYVFINTLSLMAAISPFNQRPVPDYVPGVSDNRECLLYGMIPPDFGQIQAVGGCTFMDVNPIDSLNDLGHNYFLSKNPYKLISYAVFGEIYYNLNDTLKLTGGLRYTVDMKEAPRVPSWVLAEENVGHPVTDVIEQEWREPTGRLTLDWKPDLAWTDDTMVYASYAHGYKAGGANPPPPGPVMYCPACGGGPLLEAVVNKSATHPRTFEPEFVDAFEIGAKNTMWSGQLTLNLAAFYYDYRAYQISQIINRSAINLNFDAEVWGLEIEADWRPLENLKFGFKGGYESTRVGDGMSAVDVMDRTAGREGWLVVKPFPTFPSNCILPIYTVVYNGEVHVPGNVSGGEISGCELAYVLGEDPLPNPYPGYPGFDPATAPNNGEGFSKDLSGNQLPNAPEFTATITADYTIPLPNEWLATLHTDIYYQTEAWWRIFNTPGYDKLKAYTNVNLAAIFTNEAAGWKVMAYIKNVMDRDSITGAFLNSDDTGLTTNVFLTEPRLYGLRITKDWSGGPWWTGGDPASNGPFPLTVELGGQIQRHDAPYDRLAPAFDGLFPAAIDPQGTQNQDLDWGDGREVAVTWRPSGSPWSVVGGVRFGKTNGAHQLRDAQAANQGCLVAQSQCDLFYEVYGPLVYFDGPNYVVAETTDREEYTVVDFEVGRDIGFGGLASRLSAGLRHAQLESTTRFELDGIPDWVVPDEFAFFQPLTHHLLEARLGATREFEGTGPVVGWDAGKTLFGGEESGEFGVEWKLRAGVLFGKQNTAFAGEASSTYYNGPKYGQNHRVPDGPPEVFAAPDARSESVTVPLADLSLGVAYEARRLKVSAGYRWERYFDALDAGFDEAKDADRTIDGPYFKLAVGFGG